MRRRRTKSKFSHLIFSTVRRVNGTLGVYFTIGELKFSSIRVCITFLFLSWSCSDILSTGRHFESTQFLLNVVFSLYFQNQNYTPMYGYSESESHTSLLSKS